MNAGEQRSLAETPTWSVATVTTVMVAVCFVVQRSIYQFGKWLRRTKRKALLASLEKIKEELMLLGLISLLLGQCARWISEICVKSSLFTSRFYPCSQGDFAITEDISHIGSSNLSWTGLRRRWLQMPPNNCSKGYEPFVSYESLKQLHRFLFILGITHVSYSCITVVFSMIKIYSWRKWENQANPLSNEYLEGIFISDLHSTCPKYYLSPSRRTAIRMLQKFKIERITNNDRDIRRKYFPFHMRSNIFVKRQSSFVFQHTSHPWSKNKILIWMLCFMRQFKSSIRKSDYMALRLGFITYHKLPHSYNFHRYMVRSMEDEFHGIVGISWPLWIYAITCICVNIHGLNVYFWLSFIPFILVMLVGTKLQHVVAQLALEIEEATGPFAGSQLKPRDDLFWFGKPSILLWLIQFISFQNSFEMASFIWSLWGIKKRQCFMKNHLMIIIRLTSGILAQFWCSYSTVPVNVIVTQMGSRFKKALISESVRESLHSWCKRVKEKSKRDGTARSVCSLDTTLDDIDEEITVVTGGTLSRSSSSVTRRSVSSKQQDEIRGAESQAEYETSDQPPLDSTSQLPHISSSTRRETFSRVSDQHAESENDASDDEGW